MSGPRVRLIEAPRPPATPIERLAVETLRREGALPFDTLFRRLASGLYCEELRNGSWVLDLGIVGTLFVPEAVRGLEAGDDCLWAIEKPERAR